MLQEKCGDLVLATVIKKNNNWELFTWNSAIVYNFVVALLAFGVPLKRHPVSLGERIVG